MFENLKKYLEIIKDVMSKIDSKAEIYIFGSIVEGEFTMSSDVDVLIVTRVKPEVVHAELWRNGIKDPFEIHVQPPENLPLYRRKCKLTKI